MPAVPTPAMPTPPVVAPADEAGWNAVDDSGDATPGWENEMVAPAAPASGPAPWDPTASTSAPGWGSEPEPAREPAPRHLPAPVAWVGNWVRANKLTVVVAVVAVALVVVVFATRTPTEPDGSTPTTTLADLPTAPDVPSVEALNQLTTALTSGEAPTVQAVMVAPVGDNLGAMEAVRWFGIAKLGFVVAWEKPTTTGEGKATARGTVVDSANRPIADVTAELVKQPNGSWQVTKWPSFSAPGA